VLLVVALAVVSAACTGGDDQPPSPSSSASASGDGVRTSNVAVQFQPGKYSYQYNNVSASLSMESGGSTLQVKNNSGQDLGKPGMYVLSQDDKRYEGTVESPATIPDGETTTFTVTFPEQVKPDTVGLLVLLFGGSNYGAMKPVPAG
jgi:hypothetical protein